MNTSIYLRKFFISFQSDLNSDLTSLKVVQVARVGGNVQGRNPELCCDLEEACAGSWQGRLCACLRRPTGFCQHHNPHLPTSRWPVLVVVALGSDRVMASSSVRFTVEGKEEVEDSKAGSSSRGRRYLSYFMHVLC